MQAHPGPLPPLLQTYVFSWETMHTIIGGRSAIDLSHLRLTDHGSGDEAYRFLQRYGYDLNRASHVEEVERIRVEGLGFLRGMVLQGLPDVHVPDGLDTLPILDVLRIAAGGAPVPLNHQGVQVRADLATAWSCALLRVMHTVAHAANYFQNNFYPEIRERILNRFVQQVRTREDGSQFLHCASFDVPLVRFEVKETKPLRSVVLKLLQKQENVAYDLFDHIGVRIIVRRPVDALFAVRALREEHTIMYPNIKPTRSRNTLIDLDAYDLHVRACLLKFQRGELDEAATARAIHLFDIKPAGSEQIDWNPYSSDKYRSIQFTSRQMIRLENPLYTRLLEAQIIARKHLRGDQLQEMLMALSTIGVEPNIQFFFPYEVQVMDIASYEAATSGRASYAEYKQRQIASVRRRVMPRVLELLGITQESGAGRVDPAQAAGGSGARKRGPFASTGILPHIRAEDLQIPGES